MHYYICQSTKARTLVDARHFLFEFEKAFHAELVLVGRDGLHLAMKLKEQFALIIATVLVGFYRVGVEQRHFDIFVASFCLVDRAI